MIQVSEELEKWSELRKTYETRPDFRKRLFRSPRVRFPLTNILRASFPQPWIIGQRDARARARWMISRIKCHRFQSRGKGALSPDGEPVFPGRRSGRENGGDGVGGRKGTGKVTGRLFAARWSCDQD